jgi:hypothetical protein
VIQVRNFCASIVLLNSCVALGVVVPFTEQFSSSGANWSSSPVFTPLNYPSSGGPDGSAFGSQNFSFANQAAFNQPILFRGQSNFNSSGNAFVGDWISAGVTTVSFDVRHNAAAPIDYFVRFAPAFGAGVVGLFSAPVQPGVWTTLSFSVNSSNPQIIFEGTTFATFSSIARTQVGILVPQSLAGNQSSFSFDIDNFSVVPAPSAFALLVSGACLATRRRRR